MILGRDKHVHSACFDELDAAVSALLAEAEDPRVVCFNAQWFPAPAGAVVYNLENVPGQVGTGAWADREVWDFSWRSAALLNSYPHRLHPVKHVPVGFHESMVNFEPLPMSARPFDVAFAGSMNERRAHLLDRIAAKGLKVKVVPHESYGAVRDAIFAQAKLVINPLYYPDGIYPQLRTLHALSNSVLTVSEDAYEAPLWSPIRVPYEYIPDRVASLLKGETLDSLAARSVEAHRLLAQNHRMRLPVD